MKKLLFSAASMLLFLGSCCQNELEENVLPKGQSVVTATIEGQNDSRLAVTPNADNSVFTLNWSEGDSFKVFDDGEGAVYEWTSGEEFTASTTPTNPTYAVYPYTVSNAPTISGSTVTMTLNATPSVANINLPMWAGAPTNNNYAFKHLAAALQFTLNDIPAGYNQLIVTASNAISGAFTADLNASEPVLASTSTADADKKVTVSFDAATSGTLDQVFYIPLPAGTYTSLAVSVSDGTNTKELKSWANLEVVRGKMYYTTATVDVASAKAVNEALANVTTTPTTVNLTATIDASAGALDIPDAAENVTLNFTEAPTTTESAPLTINQNDGETSGTATSELNVTMPDGARGLYATIDAPTTTVTLNGGSYSKVTATTATNTLIIGEGVTIEELVIEGGNVVLKGNVESILSTVVATTVSLEADVTLANACTISGDVTLDMGGKTITAPQGAFVVADGTFTIKNGTINANVKGYDAVAIKGATESSVIKVNVEEDATLKGGDCCVVVYGSNKSKDITINTAGTLVTESAYESSSYPGYAAISANGKSEGVKLNVTGGSITAKVAAIYFPCSTTLTITDGEITGATAVYQKSGKLTISGGKLTGNGEKEEYVYNGNGCNETGDALVIEACNYPNGNPEVEITGGEFISTKASAIGSYVAEDGGHDTSKPNPERIIGFVKGGTFHDASVFDFLASEAGVTLGADMTLTKAITIPTGITATIDLNGFDVTAPNTDAFEVQGTLTINDEDNEGVVSAGTEHPNASVCAVWANGGTITINGGHYKAYSDAVGKRNDCIYAGYNADNENTAGKITIEGGKFEYVWPDSEKNLDDVNYNGDRYLLNCADKDLYQTLITVNGGLFKNHAPSYEDTNPVERTNKEVQLGEGVKVYKGENEEQTSAHTSGTEVWYTVK